jgi:hypothetical protein
MKKCPNCGQPYSDDDLFCVTDGTTLVPGVPESAQGGYNSGNAPTQVLQRSLSQSAGPKSNSNLLYMVIGILATALVGLTVVFYVTRSKESGKEKTEANYSNSSTEYKTSQVNSNLPKNSTPASVVSEPANVPISNPYSPRGTWAGDWTSPSGAYLTIKLNLNDDGAGNVQGQIEWTLQRTNRPEKMNKIGMSAVEYVRGKYDTSSRNLTMSGYRKDDPNNVLVMVDDYRLSISQDDRNLNGAARNGGKWDGKMRLQRN